MMPRSHSLTHRPLQRVSGSVPLNAPCRRRSVQAPQCHLEEDCSGQRLRGGPIVRRFGYTATGAACCHPRGPCPALRDVRQRTATTHPRLRTQQTPSPDSAPPAPARTTPRPPRPPHRQHHTPTHHADDRSGSPPRTAGACSCTRSHPALAHHHEHDESDDHLSRRPQGHSPRHVGHRRVPAGLLRSRPASPLDPGVGGTRPSSARRRAASC